VHLDKKKRIPLHYDINVLYSMSLLCFLIALGFFSCNFCKAMGLKRPPVLLFGA
jgi:hypothetical protein